MKRQMNQSMMQQSINWSMRQQPQMMMPQLTTQTMMRQPQQVMPRPIVMSQPMMQQSQMMMNQPINQAMMCQPQQMMQQPQMMMNQLMMQKRNQQRVSHQPRMMMPQPQKQRMMNQPMMMQRPQIKKKKMRCAQPQMMQQPQMMMNQSQMRMLQPQQQRMMNQPMMMQPCMLQKKVSLEDVEEVVSNFLKAVTCTRFWMNPDTIKMRARYTKILGAERIKELKNSIINDSGAIVTANLRLAKCLEESVETVSFSSFNTVLEKIGALPYPEIGLLVECDCISRLNRAVFEDGFVQKSVGLRGSLTSLGFATGYLFPDLRILTKAIDSGKRIKAVHLIDTSYMSAIEKIKDMMGFANNAELSFAGMQEMAKKLCSKFLATKNKDVETLKCELEGLFQILVFTQFINVLTEINGQSFDLYIHVSDKAYLDCGKKANMLTMLDPEGDHDAEIKALRSKGMVKGNSIYGYLFENLEQGIIDIK